MKVARKNYVKDWSVEYNSEIAPEGMNFPRNEKLEKAVIGALMMEFEAILKVKDLLKPEHFYKKEHGIIYAAQLSLFNNGKPIDLITVVERLMEKGDLKKIGGAPVITDIANVVASTANLDYHARIIYDLHLRRAGYKMAINAANRMLKREHNIYEVREELAKESMVVPQDSVLQFRDMEQVLLEAEKQPPLKKLFGHLFHSNEVSFLFADTGVGKSILSFQIAEALAQGKDVFDGLVRNEENPLKVIYFDFELSDRNILKRYSDEYTGEKYKFSENIIHASFNPDFLNYEEKLDKLISNQIESSIIREEPDVIVIDNITFMIAESSTDAEVAMRLMKKLKFYQRRFGLSILVLGHTPKRQKINPLTINDLGGSKHLPNFADSAFAIGECAHDSTVRYIKQVKGRNGLIYDSDNVIACFIEKDNQNMLRFHYKEMGRESDYLADFRDHETQDGLIEDAIRLRMKSNNGKGWRAIAKEISWLNSHTDLQKKCEQYAQHSKQYEFNPREKTFSVSNESITPEKEWAEGKSMLGAGNDEAPF